MTTFIAKIEQGKLNFGSIFNEARYHDFLKGNEGKWVRITKPDTRRSLSQNKFYWAYLGIISHDTGDTENDLHEFFKVKLLPEKHITIKGKSKIPKEVVARKSTTELSSQEFSTFMERICALTGVPIPDPEAYKLWLDEAKEL